MAGRGCTVTVRILRQVGQEVHTDEIGLPVALHSPLSVLKDLLRDISHINVENQVLILCDLSDPDRNNDIHLDHSKDDHTLFQCGVEQGSVLALHALGISREQVGHFEDLHKNNVVTDALHGGNDRRPVQSISTDITPGQANHSYNGIIFDVMSKSPFEVDISSVAVGGMLGRVRVLYKQGTWLAAGDEDEDITDRPQRWWGAREKVSRRGWSVAADTICTPSWDRAHEIVLRKPINLLPGARVALYVHSGLPDDLGIQYQTYREGSIVAQDEHIVLFPGLGHTGAEPFDELNGWYKSYRGLAGSVRYRCHRKGWDIWNHNKFPSNFRDSVLTMLLCREHSLNIMYSNRQQLLSSRGERGLCRTSTESCAPIEPCVDRSRQLGLLHTHILYYTMEFMHWDWFRGPDEEEKEVEENDDIEEQQGSRYSSILRHLLGRASAMVAADGQELTEEGLQQLYAAIMFNAQRLYGETGEDISEFYEHEIGDDDDDDGSGNIYATDESGSSVGDDEGTGSDMDTASEGHAENMSVDSG